MSNQFYAELRIPVVIEQEIREEEVVRGIVDKRFTYRLSLPNVPEMQCELTLSRYAERFGGADIFVRAQQEAVRTFERTLRNVQDDDLITFFLWRQEHKPTDLDAPLVQRLR